MDFGPPPLLLLAFVFFWPQGVACAPPPAVHPEADPSFHPPRLALGFLTGSQIRGLQDLVPTLTEAARMRGACGPQSAFPLLARDRRPRVLWLLSA